jgi:hypothetical protein
VQQKTIDWSAVASLLIPLIIGLIFLLYPRDVQEDELKNIGNPDEVSDRIPKILKPSALYLKRKHYESSSGPGYVPMTRLMGAIMTGVSLLFLCMMFYQWLKR